MIETNEKPLVQGLCDDCKYKTIFVGIYNKDDFENWKCNKCGYPCTWVMECEMQKTVQSNICEEKSNE